MKEEASKVAASLLRNIYRAFDFKDEEDIYDSLEKSVSGDLLTEIYVDVFEALKLQDQGGARVRVDAIEMLDSVPVFDIEEPGFSIQCKWTVRGKVDHWGHGHFRVNQYEAKFTVQSIDGAWKITRQEVVGSERVS